MPDQSLLPIARKHRVQVPALPASPFPAAAFKTAGIRGVFEVHYQPVVRLSDRTVSHYEALVRLRNERGQLIAPGEFIPVAERRGLIAALDRVVVDLVLADLRLNSKVSVYLNLSGASLSDDGLREYLLESTSDPELAHRLGIELTETAIVQDLTQAQVWIDQLRAHGCRFALDDFGIGFNSFGYLRTLQFDELKIDGSFVRTVVEDAKMRALIGAIHAMADSLQLETVAEWVESPAILEVVADLGLTYAQGYALGKPAREFAIYREPLTSDGTAAVAA